MNISELSKPVRRHKYYYGLQQRVTGISLKARKIDGVRIRPGNRVQQGQGETIGEDVELKCIELAELFLMVSVAGRSSAIVYDFI